jgi:MoaA/NifB/PqqE/SkfB family radical SAM enzyme
VRKIAKRIREARMLMRALRYPYRPVVAHIIPVRRCNLSCTYCNEFDDYSSPVPLPIMRRRIDRLAELGTGIITLSGGEPMLHPDVEAIIAHIRHRGSIATIITNGYLLSRDRIKRLNRAGLDHLQISIDNVIPDEVSKKSLKVLDQKLQGLAADADFAVTVNSVVGGGIRRSEDALVIAARARDLGLSTTVGIIHDGHGGLRQLDESQRTILERLVVSAHSSYDYANYNRFQRNLAAGQPNVWHCRAGSRYLYICEDGLVHWCSQQRGHPGIPLEQYSVEDLQREYASEKHCAPFCTVGCVHRVSQVDELRHSPEAVLASWFTPPGADGPTAMPPAVRALRWAFITGPHRDRFRRAAIRMFGVERT